MPGRCRVRALAIWRPGRPCYMISYAPTDLPQHESRRQITSREAQTVVFPTARRQGVSWQAPPHMSRVHTCFSMISLMNPGMPF